MREVVLDTETTGLSPAGGHRIVEIGCVELINHMPSNNNFQRYLNPQRDMPKEALKVHGLTEEFLAEKPLFADIAEDLLAFLGEDQLIIHNAEFDMKFLNAELARINRPALPMSRATDTVVLARKKFPGAQASLDALCRRFEIDNTHRSLHGALLDSILLAEVYLQLIGGRQPGFELGTKGGQGNNLAGKQTASRPTRPARPHAPLPEEEEAHRRFVEKIPNALWHRISE